MLLVGLTGGLASGKSTVARMLAERGAVVVDADELAREAVAPGSDGLRRIVEAFGAGVLARDGSLDREAMARIAFADPDSRRRLEAIVHPEVLRGLADRTRALADTDRIVVFDAALLVETGYSEACDVVVVVDAPTDVQVSRATARGGLDPEEARRRIESQARREERVRRADLVIPNSGTLAELQARVAALWSALRSRTGS